MNTVCVIPVLPLPSHLRVETSLAITAWLQTITVISVNPRHKWFCLNCFNDIRFNFVCTVVFFLDDAFVYSRVPSVFTSWYRYIVCRWLWLHFVLSMHGYVSNLCCYTTKVCCYNTIIADIKMNVWCCHVSLSIQWIYWYDFIVYSGIERLFGIIKNVCITHA